MATDDFKEGFICSICMRDIKSLPQLQDHFDRAHREDRAVLQQLRGFFTRDKQKLLGEGNVRSTNVDRICSASTTSLGNEGGIDPVMWEPQGPGMSFVDLH
jgi:rabenosyn-5